VPVSSVGNPFMFTGRRWDEVLALYDYRTRYYNPYLGRFLRIDTIGLWGDANNLGNPYAYVGNNPWSRLDPWGEQPGFLGFDANGHPVRQPSPAEMWEGMKEVHRVLVAEPIRWLDPNPGPIRAALEGELLMVDRLDDLDVVDNSNNIFYTGTQLGANLIPITWFAKIGGLFRFGKQAHVAIEGAQAVNSGRGLRQGAKGTLERLPAPANTMGDAAQAAKRGGVDPVVQGRAAEERVSEAIGIPLNRGKGRAAVPGSGPGGIRIPDFPPEVSIRARGSIIEVKNVKGLYITPQLRDLAAEADKVGATLEIFTNAPTPKYGDLYDLVERQIVKITPIP
jgi:RHS repeat-associated protein